MIMPCTTARVAVTAWYTMLVAEVIEEMGMEEKTVGVLR